MPVSSVDRRRSSHIKGKVNYLRRNGDSPLFVESGY